VIQSVPTYSGIVCAKQTLVRAFSAPDSVCGFFVKQCFFGPFPRLTTGGGKALVSAEQSCKRIKMTQTGSTTYTPTAILHELPPGCHFAHGLSSICFQKWTSFLCDLASGGNTGTGQDDHFPRLPEALF
jgi:hypothetical protein